MRKSRECIYWLTVIGRANGYVYAEAEDGYKPCKKPGVYIARRFADGLCCPGCDRRCRIPDTAGVVHDDRLFVTKNENVSPPPCVGLSV